MYWHWFYIYHTFDFSRSFDMHSAIWLSYEFPSRNHCRLLSHLACNSDKAWIPFRCLRWSIRCIKHSFLDTFFGRSGEFYSLRLRPYRLRYIYMYHNRNNYNRRGYPALRNDSVYEAKHLNRYNCLVRVNRIIAKSHSRNWILFSDGWPFHRH